METTDLLEQARAKRTRKNADWIVANYIGTHQQGFASDYNSVTLVGDGVEESFEGPKDDLAMSLLRSIFLS
jgi:phosphopantothenoylcysteine decarboxylase/phosphopantothenate--cysteine ligase